MPSEILLTDAIEQCGEKLVETIKDALFPFNEHRFAQQIITELNNKLDRGKNLCYRLAPSIVCRSEIELYCIYMPRFGIRVNLGDSNGFGFLTLRRSNLLKNELKGVYKENPEILKELGVYKENPEIPEELNDTEDERFGKLADSIIRIPTEYTNYKAALKSFQSKTAPQSFHSPIFWNVAQAKLFKHYGGDDSDKGVPFVTHSDSSGGMCAQACIFMLQMYHIENLERINGIADITYQAGTTSNNENPTNSISLRGLKPHRVHEYVKNNFTKQSRRILSVHNLPDRTMTNENKASFEHLKNTFPELDTIPQSAEQVIQKIELEAYARSQIPQITFVDINLLYDHEKTQPAPEDTSKLDERRPHAILIIGTKYHVDQTSGFIKEEIVLNDPATGPLRTRETDFSLVECARYDGPTDNKNIKILAAFESLAILPQGITRQLAPKQTVSISDLVIRRKPAKHFTVGILEDLQRQQELVRKSDVLKRLTLMAIQFSDDQTSQSSHENGLFVLAASVLSKLKLDILRTPNQMILKDIFTFIRNKLKEFQDNLNEHGMNSLTWYWLVCLPIRTGKKIQVHLRIYDASDETMLAQPDQLNALDKGDFSINL